MYVGTSRVTFKGQVTIPQELRQKNKMKSGTEVVFIETKEGVLIKTREDIKELFNVFDSRIKELGFTRNSLEKEIEEEKGKSWKKYFKH